MVDPVRHLVALLLVLVGCSSATSGGSPDAAPPGDVDGGADGGAPLDAADPDDPIDAAPPGVPVRKLLLIGIDGVRHDKLALAHTPALSGLAARGIMSRTWIFAAPMAGTWSGPSWSSIATGVWPDKHKVVDNDFRGHDLARYPDFLTRLETARPALATYAIASWKPLAEAPGPLFSAAVDVRVMHDGEAEPSWEVADIRITGEAATYLRTQNPDAAFVYLGNVDEVGHSGDTDLRYLAAIEKTDRQIAQLVAAVEARPSYAQESWLILVTTDHGHRDGGNHGTHTWQERQSFIVAAGGDIPHTTLPFEPRLVDIAPTIFAHFGVPVDPAWNLDGVPLGTPSTDPFDTLADRLRPAGDERNIPILGWTHDVPTGWSIDNGRMPTGGTTEWRGWSFATGEFWNLTDPGQSREAFVRSRGIVAIADPDEWDDGGPAGGTFDSTLRAPPVTVTGGTTVRLRFASHYLQEGDQKGQVLVAFDERPAQVYLQYGPDSAHANRGGPVISRRETVPIQVPPGVRTLTVSWRLYDAGNNWYWAIDDPHVE